MVYSMHVKNNGGGGHSSLSGQRPPVMESKSEGRCYALAYILATLTTA